MEMKSEVKNLVGVAKDQAGVAADKLQATREDLRVELDDLLGSLSEKVSDMRATLATAAEDGSEAVPSARLRKCCISERNISFRSKAAGAGITSHRPVDTR